MGGSLSQPRTNRVHSLINAFPLEELYTPNFSESLQENIGFWQAPNPYEVQVEQVATSPTKKKKATRNRQKKTIQSDDAPQQTPWTTEEEIALCKGWLAVSQNSKHGNSRKQDGFWCETVRPSVVRFCGIYNNIIRMGPESGVGDADYVQRARIHYEIDTELPFKLRHYWEILKDHPKWQEIAIPNFNTGSEGGSKRHKSTGSSSFNTESGEASINLNTNVDDNDEDEV
ncbi:putative reverse transcriptase domain-containing protein [Tanacetum coccineum]